MRARLRDVPVGTRFTTLLTGREGRVVDHNGPETQVILDKTQVRGLASEVVVDAEEVAH